MTVDVTDFLFQEHSPFDSIWYSHKFRGPGLRYRIGFIISQGHIVWVNGPYPFGSYPNVKIFLDVLKRELLRVQMVLADRGYNDGLCVLVAPGKDLFISSLLLARHETLNGPIKAFKATSDVFRDSLLKHSSFFHAVSTLCHISILEGRELSSL